MSHSRFIIFSFLPAFLELVFQSLTSAKTGFTTGARQPEKPSYQSAFAVPCMSKVETERSVKEYILLRITGQD